MESASLKRKADDGWSSGRGEPRSKVPPKKVGDSKSHHHHQNHTWLFSENSFLYRSPSRMQKMSASQELKAREGIHDFVIKLASKLKVDGSTILAATIYINRFYMRMPITSSKYYLASAAVAVSTKLNDTYRKPDLIALNACNIKNPTPARPIDEQSDMFWRWRDQLLFREELLLKTLNFDLNVELPYEIRDSLAESHVEDEIGTSFLEKKNEILKNTTSLLEVISALPVLVSFDIQTVFGTLMIVTIIEGKKKLNDESLRLPPNYLTKRLGVDAGLCFQCYQYILKLLKVCEEDPRAVSNKVASKRLKVIEESVFKEVANEN